MSDHVFQIRPATNDDGSAVRELIFQILREFNLPPDPDKTDADLDDLECAYFKPGGRFDVLVDSTGQIIGTVGLHRIDRQTIELRKMYLKSSHRGKGLGAKLLDHALAEARLLGCKRMTLETASQLTTAIGMYTRAGFRPMCGTIQTKRCDQAYELDL
jgi:GNAT superfamily N-acetyltransferase